MFRRIIFLLILCMFGSFTVAYGQQRRIDSLEQLLDTATAAGKGRILSELSWALHTANPEKGLKFGLEAVEVFRTAGLEKEQAEAFLNIGVCYYQMDDFEKAVTYFFRSLSIKEKLNDLNGVAALYNNMGNVYKDMTNFTKSNEAYRQALRIGWGSGNAKIVATALGNLAVNFKNTGKYDSAIGYNLQSLRIRDSIGDRRGASISLNNLAVLYADSSYSGMDLEKALQYFMRSLKIKEETGDRRGMCSCLLNIGQVCSDRGDYRNALLWFEKALKLSNELRAPTLAMGCYENLANLYAKKGDFRKAYAYHVSCSGIRDSLFTVETTQKIAEMQVKYESGKKESENELLRKESRISELEIIRQKNMRNYLILTVVLILLVAIILLNRYMIKRKSNYMLEEKNRELALLNATKDKFFSIISHDLKNPFSTLVSVSGHLSKEYPRLDDEQRNRIINLIRNSANATYRLLENLLEWSRSQSGSLPYQPVVSDLSVLVGNTFALLLADAEKKELSLVSEIPIGTMIHADTNMIATVLNNLVTNAVKFSEKPGKITVSSAAKGELLEVSVRDEGPGMTPEEVGKLFRIDVNTWTIGRSKEKGTGLGLILCRELIGKNGGTIRAESEPGKGSVFTLSVPLAPPAQNDFPGLPG